MTLSDIIHLIHKSFISIAKLQGYPHLYDSFYRRKKIDCTCSWILIINHVKLRQFLPIFFSYFFLSQQIKFLVNLSIAQKLPKNYLGHVYFFIFNSDFFRKRKNVVIKNFASFIWQLLQM